MVGFVTIIEYFFSFKCHPNQTLCDCRAIWGECWGDSERPSPLETPARSLPGASAAETREQLELLAWTKNWPGDRSVWPATPDPSWKAWIRISWLPAWSGSSRAGKNDGDLLFTELIQTLQYFPIKKVFGNEKREENDKSWRVHVERDT